MTAEIIPSPTSVALPRWRLAAWVGPWTGEHADINTLGRLPGLLRGQAHGLDNITLCNFGKHGDTVTLSLESRIQNHDSALLSGATALKHTVETLTTPAHILWLSMGDYESFRATPRERLLEEMPSVTGALESLEETAEDPFWGGSAVWYELLSAQ